MLDDENLQYETEIVCQKCKTVHKIKLLQITNGEEIICQKCGTKIFLAKLDPDAEKRIKKNNEELQKLKKLLENLPES